MAVGAEVLVRAWGTTVAVTAPKWALAGLAKVLSPDARIEQLRTGTQIEVAPAAMASSGSPEEQALRNAAPRVLVHAQVAVTATGNGWSVHGVGDGDSSNRATNPWSIGPDGDAVRLEVARRTWSEVHLAIATWSPEAVFVHAGAVAWRNQGIIIPGRSMAGKSTLVRALVEQGASYLSDEYAVIDPTGRVHPYLKPLSLRHADGSEMVPARNFGEDSTMPVPVVAVVATSYQPGASWMPETCTGAQVVLPLVENAVAARLAPERVVRHAVAVAEGGTVLFTGSRGDAAAAASAILAQMDRAGG